MGWSGDWVRYSTWRSRRCTFLAAWPYKQSFTMFKYGEGAAIANVLFVILMIAAAVYLKFAYNDGEEDAR